MSDTTSLTDTEARAVLLAIGYRRTLCLICGNSDTLEAPIPTGDGDAIKTFRHDGFSARGYAHPACCVGEREVDVTGCPDYSGYNENLDKPPYPPGWDVVLRGQIADQYCQILRFEDDFRKAEARIHAEVRRRAAQGQFVSTKKTPTRKRKKAPSVRTTSIIARG